MKNLPTILQNWETSAAGTLALGAYFIGGEFVSEQVAQGAATIIVAIGMLFARDANKSSKHTGVD